MVTRMQSKFNAIHMAAVLACGAIILALTLWPSPESVEALPIGCFYCSRRATADAIANVILFMPLGAAIAWATRGSRWAWRAGLALSLLIELTQRFVIGRDPSIGDVVTNTIGAALGALLFLYLRTEARREPDARKALRAGAAASGIVVLTAWFLGPAPTTATHYAQWTPVLGHLEWYRGRVLAAHIGDEPLRAGRVSDPASLQAFVQGRGRLEVRGLAGPPPPALAPFFSVYDARQREILLLGVDREALVLRYHRRASGWRLDEPDVRLERGMAGITSADTIAIVAERVGAKTCLTGVARNGCLPGGTPGRAWSLLYYPEAAPGWMRATLDLLWLVGLALPIGWYSGMRRAMIAPAIMLAAALLAVPPLVGSSRAPPVELLAVAAGMAIGAGVRAAARQPAIVSASTATQRSIRS